MLVSSYGRDIKEIRTCPKTILLQYALNETQYSQLKYSQVYGVLIFRRYVISCTNINVIYTTQKFLQPKFKMKNFDDSDVVFKTNSRG